MKAPCRFRDSDGLPSGNASTANWRKQRHGDPRLEGDGEARFAPMLHAVVKNGRIVLDEPTDLPEGTSVVLGVYSPSTVAPDATAFLPAPLQPVIATLTELRRALDGGQTDLAAFHRSQLNADLQGVEQTDRVSTALRRLMSAPAVEIRRQDVAALELALFDARLPQPECG